VIQTSQPFVALNMENYITLEIFVWRKYGSLNLWQMPIGNHNVNSGIWNKVLLSVAEKRQLIRQFLVYLITSTDQMERVFHYNVSSVRHTKSLGLKGRRATRIYHLLEMVHMQANLS
jgi:hypothetical protein